MFKLMGKKIITILRSFKFPYLDLWNIHVAGRSRSRHSTLSQEFLVAQNLKGGPLKG